MKLYVGNLGYQISNDRLEQLFAQAGVVESALVATTLAGNSRGFGFVEMSSRAEGEIAITLLNGKEIGGRSLTVYEEKPPKAIAAGVGFSSSQRRKENSYSASRAVRWPRPLKRGQPGLDWLFSEFGLFAERSRLGLVPA